MKRSIDVHALVAACLILIPLLPVWAQGGPVMVRAQHGAKVAHIEILGTLHNGNTEVAQTGSGLRVSQQYVLTSAHLFSRLTQYKSTRIDVRLEARTAAAIEADIDVVDKENDLALVRLKDPPKATGCPYYLVTDVAAVPSGSDVYFLGMPIDGPLRITPGILSIDPDVRLPLWESSASINPGDSGAPAFTRFGYLVGIAKGVLTEWVTKERIIPIAGVTQFVPATRIRSSPIGQKVLVYQPDSRCLRAEPMNADGSFGLVAGPIGAISPPAEFVLAEALAVELQSELSYSRFFDASPGYRIVGCSFEPVRVQWASVSCSVDPNGKRAAVQVNSTNSIVSNALAGGRVILRQQPE